MGRPKGDSDKSYMSFRVTDEAREHLDTFAKNRGITRTDAILNAIHYYLSSQECVNCGALNPNYGMKCCQCGEPLYKDGEIKEALISIVSPENSMYEAVNEVLNASKEYRAKYGKLGCKVSIEPIIDRMKKPTEYRIKLVLTLADGKTKLIPDDHAEIIGEGVAISGNVLMDELEKVRKRRGSSEDYRFLSMSERFVFEHRAELMPSDKEEKPNHVKEVRKNGKED